MPEMVTLDEAEILGFFETVKSTFLTKFMVLGEWFEHQPPRVRAGIVSDETLDTVETMFAHPNFTKAWRLGNGEVVENLKEEMVTSAIINAWMVFERIIKGLPNEDYAKGGDQASADYQRSDFGLDKRTKGDLEFIYYLRNAVLHYNGCYYAGKVIDLTYGGQTYKSAGNEGKAIVVSPKTAWKIINDLEQHAMSAWTSYRRVHGLETS